MGAMRAAVGIAGATRRAASTVAAVAAVHALCACSGSAPAPAAPAAVPAVDERTAESDAKGLVAEIYRTINRGKTDSLFSLVSDPVAVFGPRSIDAMATRSDALVALGGALRGKATRGAKGGRAQLRSDGLEVVVSPGGHSAWAFDTVSLDGQALAVTAVLSSAGDLWAVTAASVAETPSGKQARAEAARDAIVPPGARATSKVDPAAAAAVDKLMKGLLDQQSWGDELASRTDAIVAGPIAGDVSRGKKAIKRLWSARIKANVREAASGEASAAVTPDGELAWVSLPVTRVADGEAPLPLRVFAVYEKAGAAWSLIALHEAAAIDEPGAGTPWKKIVPPAPEPPKAAASDARPTDTAAAKPGSKRKKPKPPSDDQ